MAENTQVTPPVEPTATTATPSVPSVETQHTPPQEPVVDTTPKEAGITTDAVGLKKEAPKAAEETSKAFSDNLNSLVNKAVTGELSDEDKKSLEASGLSSHFEMIVAGVKAKQAETDNEIYSVVGGKESYTELQKWAVNTLSDAELESFNKAVLKSGDIGVAKLAVEALQARYISKHGQAPAKVLEGGGSVVQADTFSSPMEYINETRTHKYRTDAEYAKQVEAKRFKSNF